MTRLERSTPSGQQNADKGLYYLRARYYDPEIGRFLTRDPLPGLVANAQTQNRYSYVGNNPVTYIDPLGLYFTHLGGGVGGATRAPGAPNVGVAPLVEGVLAGVGAGAGWIAGETFGNLFSKGGQSQTSLLRGINSRLRKNAFEVCTAHRLAYVYRSSIRTQLTNWGKEIQESYQQLGTAKQREALETFQRFWADPCSFLPNHPVLPIYIDPEIITPSDKE